MRKEGPSTQIRCLGQNSSRRLVKTTARVTTLMTRLVKTTARVITLVTFKNLGKIRKIFAGFLISLTGSLKVGTVL